MPETRHDSSVLNVFLLLLFSSFLLCSETQSLPELYVHHPWALPHTIEPTPQEDVEMEISKYQKLSKSVLDSGCPWFFPCFVNFVQIELLGKLQIEVQSLKRSQSKPLQKWKVPNVSKWSSSQSHPKIINPPKSLDLFKSFVHWRAMHQNPFWAWLILRPLEMPPGHCPVWQAYRYGMVSMVWIKSDGIR